MKLLLHHMRAYILHVIASLLLILTMVGAQLWQPRLLQSIMDSIIKDQMDDVYTIGIKLLLIAGVGLIAGILNTLTAAHVANGVSADLRARLFKKIQTFSLSNVEKFSTGNLVVRQTRDVQAIQGLAMMLLQTLASIPFMFVGGFIMGMIVLPQLWWVMIILIVLVMSVNMTVMAPLGKKFEKIMKLVERLNALTKDNLLGIRVVKSFVQGEKEGERFTDMSDLLTKYSISVGRAFAIMIPAYTFASQLAVLLAVFLVGNMVTDDPTVIGAFASYMTYLGMIMGAIIMGGFLTIMASQGMVSLKRVKEVLDTEPDITYVEEDGIESKKLDGSVEFKNVSFQYPDDHEHSLHNVSFTVKPGEIVGIVGTTGSGKSTLAQLIPRLFDPVEGEVYVGGKNIREVSKKTLRNSVSIVLQKAVLFSGTIADNLRHGKSNASEADMDRATRIAQAAEFITRNTQQYVAEVEERGMNYSGGQKQRISIARGIISEPSVLILDDSTSALDARSERLVKEGINTELKGTTTFIIAQKISSVVHANKILVLDQGQLVGVGTHKELKESCAAYIEIYETQKGREAQEASMLREARELKERLQETHTNLKGATLEESGVIA